MELLGIAFIVITIGAIAVPFAGIIMLYSDDLSELIIPPEIEETLSNSIDIEELQLPQYVSSSFDTSTRTGQAIFNFTNPFEFNLTINSISSDLQCIDHGFPVGDATLDDQVQINDGETKEFAINFVWTESAETHFLNEHENETSIDVELVDMQLDISGIDIEIPEQVTLSLPLVP